MIEEKETRNRMTFYIKITLREANLLPVKYRTQICFPR
jgi:hypothetical protein